MIEMPSLIRIKENKEFLAQYLQAISILYQTGLMEFLRESGRVAQATPTQPHYLEAQAMNASFSAGYNACIDTLLYFRELVLEPTKEPKRMSADFGALDIAVQKGDLTEEESNAIRAGQPIDYSRYTDPSNSNIGGRDIKKS